MQTFQAGGLHPLEHTEDYCEDVMPLIRRWVSLRDVCRDREHQALVCIESQDVNAEGRDEFHVRIKSLAGFPTGHSHLIWFPVYHKALGPSVWPSGLAFLVPRSHSCSWSPWALLASGSSPWSGSFPVSGYLLTPPSHARKASLKPRLSQAFIHALITVGCVPSEFSASTLKLNFLGDGSGSVH